MKKETIIAIVFGILLGTVGAFVMITKAKQIGTNRTIQESKRNSATTPSARTANLQLLKLTAPKDRSLSTKNSIKIKGKTEKDSLIVVQSPIKELSLKSKTASFQIDFPLALGENIISITSYPKDSQVPAQQKILKIYYLEEE